MKKINVDGNEIFIDDEDYDFLINFYNLRMEGLYVFCNVKRKFRGMGLYSGLQLQKLLMQPEKLGKGIVVDHKDGNECNYQKDNLRVCTHPENMRNRKPHRTYRNKPTTSIYKGVKWHPDQKVWKSTICKDGVEHVLGGFYDEISAANCYNYWAPTYHGEFAQLNDVEFMTKEEWTKNRRAKNKTSQFRGVSLNKGKWTAQICKERKNIIIGHYETEIEAAIAYNEKALELKGKNARLNFFEK